ncbi:hypothetical protein SUDANB96_06591 [Streptomyces sp. enrichment culture]
MELDCRDTEFLFQVLTEREEMNIVAVVSNESFSGWTKTFTVPRLCATHRRTASPPLEPDQNSKQPIDLLFGTDAI